ncbi:MAG TPA: sigma-54 dependent transcriptional regulator [Bacteroidales bacterium]|nr:sigma-54 dependent transcriptional regulator [Bacteroidales bacterium]
MKNNNLLIVDDNRAILNSLRLLLKPYFATVRTISNPAQLYSELEKNDTDVILLDMNFKAGINTGNEGLFWLREIKKRSPLVEVVMITAYGDVELAVKSLREGAADFVLKPWDNEKLKATLEAASRLRNSSIEISDLRSREKILRQDVNRSDVMVIGKSAAMEGIMKLVDKISDTDASVMITGENGTGKEVIAREIHRRSGRNNELFVMVDLSSLSESLFESELFGHKKGSFTDAHEEKTGRFTLAHMGTLFLDEIGNIPLKLQAKILTVLQTHVVTPVGSNKEIGVDFRLISATNNNLADMVANKQFRQDLLYRMNTIQIHIPPLRERIEDIEDLARHFLKIYGKKYNKNHLGIHSDGISKLEKNPWYGNIRELQHTIEKAVILAEGDELRAVDFMFLENGVPVNDQTETLEEMERKMIISTLKKNNNNQGITAEQLGITRQTLYNKLKKYGI